MYDLLMTDLAAALAAGRTWEANRLMALIAGVLK
jgi:hypothetical protein